MEAHDHGNQDRPARLEQQPVEKWLVLVEHEHRFHKFVTCEPKARVSEDFLSGMKGGKLGEIDVGHGYFVRHRSAEWSLQLYQPDRRVTADFAQARRRILPI
jgi:hypothetical protein